MARPRPKRVVDAEHSEEAATIRALAGVYLRAADPPFPAEITGDETPEELRRICEGHPDDPRAVSVISSLDAADEIEAA